MQMPSRWRSQRGVTSWSQTMRCWACGSAKRLFVSLSPCTPEVLAHMPASVFRAWSHGSGPCQADWDESVRKVCMCESADVRLHLLQPRGIVWHVTPDPAPPGENMGAWGRLRFLPADVAACDGRLHIDVFTSGPAFICLYKHLSGLGTPPLLPHSPTPPTQSVCSLPDGVPGSPLTPCCTMTDGTAQPCQPSRRPLYCTVTGIWHLQEPFIKTTTAKHLSFLISLPISVIL